jgi:hypothetical protein
MEIIIALLIIAVCTSIILGYTTYNLLSKNEKLEEITEFQQTYLNEVNRVIVISANKLEEIDKKGTFKSDDEIGWFFKDILYIQSLLNNFISYEKEETDKKDKNQSQSKSQNNQEKENSQKTIKISQEDFQIHYPNPGTSEFDNSRSNPNDPGPRFRTY